MGMTSLGPLALAVLLAKATVLLLAALGASGVLRRAPAGVRYLVWLGTLGALLVIPALGAWGPLRLPPLATATLPTMRAVGGLLPAPASPAPPLAVGGAHVIPPSPSAATAAGRIAPPDPTAVPAAGVSTATGLLALWAAVALAGCLTFARAWLAVRRIVGRARRLDGPEWRDPLYEVADRLGLADAPRLLESAEVAMPFACGLRRPTVVLPAASAAWTPERRRAVLLHELAHVRRRDLVGHTLARVVCAVYWFHPLVWTAARRLRAEGERACDDLALATGTPAADYAEHLLEIVASVRRDRTPAAALAMARRREFEGRVLDILDPERPRRPASRRQQAALAGALALLTAVVGAAAPAPAAQVAPLGPGAAPRARVARPVAGTPETAPSSPALPAAPPAPRPSASVGTAAAPEDGASTVGTSTADLAVADTPTAGVEVAADATPAAPSTPADPASAAAGRAAAVRAAVDAARARALRGGAAGGTTRDDTRAELLARVLRADTSGPIRRIAAWGLVEYVSAPAATAALAAAVRGDRAPDVREMAAWALGGEGRYGGGARQEGAARDALTGALRVDADARVRETAAWVLGSAGDRGAADALVAALGDSSARVRATAAWALGNLELPAAPRALVARLGDREARVRELTAWALFTIHDPAAVPALQAALRAEGDPRLQLADIRALGAFGAQSVHVLRALLDSPDARVKAAAVRALAGGDMAGIWPWPWPRPRPFP